MGELESVAQRPTSSGFNLPASSAAEHRERERGLKVQEEGKFLNDIDIVQRFFVSSLHFILEFARAHS